MKKILFALTLVQRSHSQRRRRIRRFLFSRVLRVPVLYLLN